MHEDPFKLNPEHQFILGAAIIVLTASVQSIVLFANAGFVFSFIGFTGLMIYVSAAGCYILLPWLTSHLDVPLHGVKIALLAFCFWIGAEETLHASHDYQTPEIAVTIAGTIWDSPTARQAANVLVVAALLLMIELLSHLQHHAITLFRHAQHHRRRK